MIEIKLHTYAQALEDLQAVVAERGPDFVYVPPVTDDDGPDLPSCRYEFNGEPSCGLGKVFADRWGVPLDQVAELDSVPGDATGLLAERGHRLTRTAEALLFGFQHAQDDSTPYGEALELAVRVTNIGVHNDTRPSFTLSEQDV